MIFHRDIRGEHRQHGRWLFTVEWSLCNFSHFSAATLPLLEAWKDQSIRPSKHWKLLQLYKANSSSVTTGARLLDLGSRMSMSQ